MPTSRQFDKFSQDAQAVLLRSQELAEQRKGGVIGSEDLLQALFVLPMQNAVRELLAEYAIDIDQIELVLSLNAIDEGRASRDGLTDEARRVLEQSALQAIHTRSPFVEPTHLLWAMVSDSASAAHAILTRTGVQPEHLRSQLEQLFHEHLHLDRMVAEHLELFDPNEDDGHESGPNPMHAATSTKKKSMLELATVNLVSLEKQGELDPLIGRTDELTRLMQILLRRSKNNPILVGQPGVGKTALIEGLAHRLAEGTVPAALQSFELRRLDVTALLAGTMYRGQFEDRLHKLINEVTSRGNIILFIDEIHTVIGAGSAEGSLDAANMLKPALTTGKLRVIGATTLDEYQKHIEKDAAFERRFQPLTVAEPTAADTVRILQGLRDKLQSHHKVIIPDEILEHAVELADRYIAHRQFPDKAIDVIDEAAASVQMSLPAATKGKSAIQSLERQLKTISREKAYELKRQNVERAAFLRDLELKLKLKLTRARSTKQASGTPTITDSTLVTTVSRMTGIPLSQLTVQTLHPTELTETLGASIVGQGAALSSVARAVARARAGFIPKERPRAALLFAGPTGVGKTATAYALARTLFGSDDALIRLDMSEYREPHTVSRLIGAPPGYVGHEDAGRLTEKLRQRPASVVLFDEIEKAHPDVFNTLLQVLDYGTLTDAKGRAVSFRNAYIVLTTNAGADAWQSLTPGFLGGNDQRDRVRGAVKSLLKPELLNRLNDVIVFTPLETSTFHTLLATRIDKLNATLKSAGLSVALHPSAADELVRRASASSLGVRELDRLLGEHVETGVVTVLTTKSRRQRQMVLTFGSTGFRLGRTRQAETLAHHG